MGRKKKRKKGRSPGVYVEEVSSGARPIEGVGTSVAAFVGFPERHPLGTVLLTAAAVSLVVVVAVRARRG
jgi:phage tail sheath protein FI